MLRQFLDSIIKKIINQSLNIILVLCLYFVILYSEANVLFFIPNCLKFIFIKPIFMNNNKEMFEIIYNFALSFISAIIIYNITKKVEREKNKVKLSISYPALYKYIYEFRGFVLSMYKCSINKVDVEDFIFDHFEWAVYSNYRFIKNIKKDLLAPYGDVKNNWNWGTSLIVYTTSYVNNIDRYFELYKNEMPDELYKIFTLFLKHDHYDIPSIYNYLEIFSFEDMLILLHYKEIMDFTHNVLIYLNDNSTSQYQSINREQYLNAVEVHGFNSGVVRNV